MLYIDFYRIFSYYLLNTYYITVNCILLYRLIWFYHLLSQAAVILRPPLDLETSSSGNCCVRRVTGLEGGRTWQELGFMIHDTQWRFNMEGAVESLQISPFFAEDFVHFF